MLSLFVPFAISFFMGLLLGIERERNLKKGEQGIGVRTFILFATLGTTAATLNQTLITFSICLFVFSLITLNYLKTTILNKNKSQKGITTELASGMVFLLGYIIKNHAVVGIIISAMILLALLERKRLHRLSHKYLKPKEIEPFLFLIIFSLGILPILPNKPIDPWNLFNPQNFALLVTVIAGMQYAGYFAIKILGQTLGRAFLGFFGGLVSSTAVFVTLKDNLRSNQYMNATIASAILATSAMTLEFAAILLIASPELLATLLLPLTVVFLLCIVIALSLIFKQGAQQKSTNLPQTPIKLSSVAISAGFIGSMLIIIAFAKQYLGVYGMQFIAFVGSLFELHAVTLATALLYLDNNLNLYQASETLKFAFIAAFFSKFIILWALTPRQFAIKTCLLLLAALVPGILIATIF